MNGSRRRILGFLLAGGTESVLRGTCNRTRVPREGSILVTPFLEAGMYDAIVAARAVVCGSGGLTGHMQSLCRGRGIPVLRVDEADLADLVGEVTLYLESASIVVGPEESAPPGTGRSAMDDLGSACAVIADLQDITTINSSGPDAARVESFFIREEFLCLALGLSPLDAMAGGPAGITAYGQAIGGRLRGFVEALLPGQRLILRMLDLRSDHAAEVSEIAPVAVEPNPEMGLHGARWLLRSVAYRDALHVVLSTLRKHLGDQAGRVVLSVPFVRDETEFVQLRAHLDLPDEAPCPRSSRRPPPFTPPRRCARPVSANCSSASRTWCSSIWRRTAATTWSPTPTAPVTRLSWTGSAGSWNAAAPRVPRCGSSPWRPISTTTWSTCPPPTGT